MTFNAATIYDMGTLNENCASHERNVSPKRRCLVRPAQGPSSSIDYLKDTEFRPDPIKVGKSQINLTI